MITVGIDNGSSGSYAVIKDGVCLHFGPVPTKEALHYGKKGGITMRLDRQKLAQTIELFTGGLPCRAYVERPFTGGPMFINTMLVARAFYEATLCCMEDSHIGVQTVDSREWQKPILGEIKGSPALKKASMLKGCQLYPQWAGAIKKHGDADGLLIAHRFSQS